MIRFYIASSILLFLILTNSSFVSAQEKLKDLELLKEPDHWYEGTITLKDDRELQGLVKYDDKEGFVAYQDGDNKKVFTQASVLWFSFFDDNLNATRTFLSLPFPDANADGSKTLIFEVIREYKDFAVLLRKEPISVYQVAINKAWGGPLATSPNTNQSRKEVSQTETIFLLDNDGKISPYIEVTHREDGTKSLITRRDRKTRSKIVDHKLLTAFVTEPIYEKLEKFAGMNDLSLKHKDDFLKIISYYDTLVKEN
jgi:hypothetical protein